MDWLFIERNIPLYIEAMKLTLGIGALGVVLSVVIGFLCSMVRYYRVPVLNRIVGIYIELSRNTPLLIQLFFLYYGLPKIGIKLNAFVIAVIGLTFLGASYMSEAFRGWLEAVNKIQEESGLSIGLTKPQLMRYIILPQALAIAMPSVGANVIFLLKETSVFSAIALADLMFVAKYLIGIYYKTNEALFMLVVAYLIILLPISVIFSVLERKARYAGFGN